MRTPWVRDEAASTPNHPVGNFVQGVTRPVKISGITDGTSKTMLVAEKYVRSDEYDSGPELRRSGWSDGWDADTSCVPRLSLRSTTAIHSAILDRWVDQYFADPNASTFTQSARSRRSYNCFHFGSAHTNGINAAFADGSVHSINYDVDLVIFNALGTRAGTACGSGGPEHARIDRYLVGRQLNPTHTPAMDVANWSKCAQFFCALSDFGPFPRVRSTWPDRIEWNDTLTVWELLFND